MSTHRFLLSVLCPMLFVSVACGQFSNTLQHNFSQNATHLHQTDSIGFICTLGGMYGPNCSIPCPINCANRSCDKISGSCHECTAGFKGGNCGELCLPGTFGQNCAWNCSSRCEHNECDRVSGNCMVCGNEKKDSDYENCTLYIPEMSQKVQFDDYVIGKIKNNLTYVNFTKDDGEGSKTDGDNGGLGRGDKQIILFGISFSFGLVLFISLVLCFTCFCFCVRIYNRAGRRWRKKKSRTIYRKNAINSKSCLNDDESGDWMGPCTGREGNRSIFCNSKNISCLNLSKSKENEKKNRKHSTYGLDSSHCQESMSMLSINETNCDHYAKYGYGNKEVTDCSLENRKCASTEGLGDKVNNVVRGHQSHKSSVHHLPKSSAGFHTTGMSSDIEQLESTGQIRHGFEGVQGLVEQEFVLPSMRYFPNRIADAKEDSSVKRQLFHLSSSSKSKISIGALQDATPSNSETSSSRSTSDSLRGKSLSSGKVLLFTPFFPEIEEPDANSETIVAKLAKSIKQEAASTKDSVHTVKISHESNCREIELSSETYHTCSVHSDRQNKPKEIDQVEEVLETTKSFNRIRQYFENISPPKRVDVSENLNEKTAHNVAILPVGEQQILLTECTKGGVVPKDEMSPAKHPIDDDKARVPGAQLLARPYHMIDKMPQIHALGASKLDLEAIENISPSLDTLSETTYTVKPIPSPRRKDLYSIDVKQTMFDEGAGRNGYLQRPETINEKEFNGFERQDIEISNAIHDKDDKQIEECYSESFSDPKSESSSIESQDQNFIANGDEGKIGLFSEEIYHQPFSINGDISQTSLSTILSRIQGEEGLNPRSDNCEPFKTIYEPKDTVNPKSETIFASTADDISHEWATFEQTQHEEFIVVTKQPATGNEGNDETDDPCCFGPDPMCHTLYINDVSLKPTAMDQFQGIRGTEEPLSTNTTIEYQETSLTISNTDDITTEHTIVAGKNRSPIKLKGQVEDVYPVFKTGYFADHDGKQNSLNRIVFSTTSLADQAPEPPAVLVLNGVPKESCLNDYTPNIPFCPNMNDAIQIPINDIDKTNEAPWTSPSDVIMQHTESQHFISSRTQHAQQAIIDNPGANTKHKLDSGDTNEDRIKQTDLLTTKSATRLSNVTVHRPPMAAISEQNQLRNYQSLARTEDKVLKFDSFEVKRAIPWSKEKAETPPQITPSQLLDMIENITPNSNSSDDTSSLPNDSWTSPTPEVSSITLSEMASQNTSLWTTGNAEQTEKNPHEMEGDGKWTTPIFGWCQQQALQFMDDVKIQGIEESIPQAYEPTTEPLIEKPSYTTIFKQRLFRTGKSSPKPSTYVNKLSVSFKPGQVNNHERHVVLCKQRPENDDDALTITEAFAVDRHEQNSQCSLVEDCSPDNMTTCDDLFAMTGSRRTSNTALFTDKDNVTPDHVELVHLTGRSHSCCSNNNGFHECVGDRTPFGFCKEASGQDRQSAGFCDVASSQSADSPHPNTNGNVNTTSESHDLGCQTEQNRKTVAPLKVTPSFCVFMLGKIDNDDGTTSAEDSVSFRSCVDDLSHSMTGDKN